MMRILDKSILFGIGAVLVFQMETFTMPVVVLLAALVMAALGLYVSDQRVMTVLWIAYLLLCVVYPEFSYFLPLLFYDSVWHSLPWGFVGVLVYYPAREIYTTWMTAIWILASVLAVFMAYKSEKNEKLKANMIHLRDTDMERKLVMDERNRELLEKQDYEIYLATLKERNRIAREIHDNVGHMLSRSILQVGALATVCKEESVQQQLDSIHDTLNHAMNSIRESVHDLHDDAVDLRQAVLEATKEMRRKYEVHMEYDMSSHVPRSIKYCFIAIVKEAMSNIVKHSNADRVDLIFREHPGFYQLCIEDNGKEAYEYLSMERGMGLSNMRDRVDMLGGTLHIRSENGFRIFVTIQKMEEME